MPTEGFSCKQCGNCCLNLVAHQSCATKEDLALWEENGREDILDWVEEVVPGVYDIWIHPRTGEDVGRCPWLRKLPRQERYVCRIHDMKPEMCRNYPLSRKHAGETGCRGFGPDKPRSSEQRDRLTDMGRQVLEALEETE